MSNKNVADKTTCILDGKTLKPFHELKELSVTFGLPLEANKCLCITYYL